MWFYTSYQSRPATIAEDRQRKYQQNDVGWMSWSWNYHQLHVLQQIRRFQ